MYSRSRLPPAGYRSSVPPQYSGNLFRPVRREKTEPYLPPEPAAPSSDTADTEESVAACVPEDQPQEHDKAALSVSEGKEPFPDKIRQEDKILLGVLLLLSAEHEHAMDMIVILLLLLGIR